MHKPLRRLPPHHRPHKLDILGALAMAIASMALLLALDRAAQHGWFSAPVVMLLAVSGIFWVGFALRSSHAPEPLIPFAILRDPVVATATSASFFSFGSFVGLTLVVPVFLQFGRGLATGVSAAAFLILTFTTVVGGALGGGLMMRVRRYRLIGVISHTAAALALLLLALFGSKLPFSAIGVLFAIVGTGLGTVFPLGTVAVQSAVALHHLGIATATLLFIRSLGGAVGAAMLGGIAFAGSVVQDSAATAFAFAIAFAGAAVFAVLGAIGFALMEDRPLRNTVSIPQGD
jgi:hypothetical protein